jgi:hypothetical protein
MSVYQGKYRNDFGSIFPIGDLTEAIPEGVPKPEA